MRSPVAELERGKLLRSTMVHGKDVARFFPARGGRVRVGGGVAGAPADVRARQAGDLRQETVAQREVVSGDCATRRTKVVREDNVRQLADGRLEAVASRLSLT